jgi:hypothetical protein
MKARKPEPWPVRRKAGRADRSSFRESSGSGVPPGKFLVRSRRENSGSGTPPGKFRVRRPAGKVPGPASRRESSGSGVPPGKLRGRFPPGLLGLPPSFRNHGASAGKASGSGGGGGRPADRSPFAQKGRSGGRTLRGGRRAVRGGSRSAGGNGEIRASRLVGKGGGAGRGVGIREGQERLPAIRGAPAAQAGGPERRLTGGPVARTGPEGICGRTGPAAEGRRNGRHRRKGTPEACARGTVKGMKRMSRCWRRQDA